ncbi:MAG TPA: hypothetical protein VNH11_26495 [Pirellulales bacterium]|nr:hypothetical protein [Pirellulales bacterium]
MLLDVLGRRIRDERLMRLIRLIVASGEGVLADEGTNDYFPGWRRARFHRRRFPRRPK